MKYQDLKLYNNLKHSSSGGQRNWRRPNIEVITAFSEELKPNEVAKRCNVEKADTLTWDNQQYQRVQYENIYLFSAYYDDRYTFRNESYHFVRVLSVVRDSIETKLTCYLWPENESVPYTISVHQLELWQSMWGLGSSQPLYKTYLLSCFVPFELRYKVNSISISSHECKKPETLLSVSNVKNASDKKRKDFVVCVKAIDFEEDISKRLVEWIELQTILGANKISFYLFQTHPNVSKVLDYYQSLGIVEQIELSLPGQLPNVPKERSQYLRDNHWQKRRLELMPYNDCFYKHLYSHQFAVLLDIDEAIVPVVHSTWKQLLENVFEYQRSALTVCPSFSVSNVYFFDTFKESGDLPNKSAEIPDSMHMLRHVRRSANFSKAGYAVKSFISTNSTLAVFNHYHLFPLYGYMKRYGIISKSLAQLNHYRNKCPNTMRKECSENFTKYTRADYLLWKYKDQLIARFRHTIDSIQFVN
ncbi:uncharacterized protein B4U79_09461 [Dinothrombium tinctorium]|uniref:Glycosyltransferase family 92 protein n=1 Tax=Dinothrombium tinctorium TaxID=1965070 RepID=A0A443QVE2_9ACAR|nr:uncharacterized protein B4U79_09461 [Dinothrombium tinctorium]